MDRAEQIKAHVLQLKEGNHEQLHGWAHLTAYQGKKKSFV